MSTSSSSIVPETPPRNLPHFVDTPRSTDGEGVNAFRVAPDDDEMFVSLEKAHADEPERLQLSVEVRTGLEVDENLVLRKLSQAQWLDRKQRLEKLGGPCDVAK